MANWEYNHSKVGVAQAMLDRQRRSSKERGHKAPNYSRAELIIWLYDNGYTKLFQEWVDSGYDRDMKPSADRKDDYKSYTLDNLQLVTFRENYTKASKDMKKGINNKQSKAVVQLTLDGEVVAEFFSGSEAGRILGLDNSSIAKCCKGKANQVGDYKFKFKEEL